MYITNTIYEYDYAPLKLQVMGASSCTPIWETKGLNFRVVDMLSPPFCLLFPVDSTFICR